MLGHAVSQVVEPLPLPCLRGGLVDLEHTPRSANSRCRCANVSRPAPSSTYCLMSSSTSRSSTNRVRATTAPRYARVCRPDAYRAGCASRPPGRRGRGRSRRRSDAGSRPPARAARATGQYAPRRCPAGQSRRLRQRVDQLHPNSMPRPPPNAGTRPRHLARDLCASRTRRRLRTHRSRGSRTRSQSR